MWTAKQKFWLKSHIIHDTKQFCKQRNSKLHILGITATKERFQSEWYYNMELNVPCNFWHAIEGSLRRAWKDRHCNLVRIYYEESKRALFDYIGKPFCQKCCQKSYWWFLVMIGLPRPQLVKFSYKLKIWTSLIIVRYRRTKKLRIHQIAVR